MKLFQWLVVLSLLALTRGQSILDNIQNDEGLTSLAAAIQVAGLEEVLDGEGNFTVFAPTNDAFAAFLEANELSLGDIPESTVVALLTYHVLSGAVMSTDLEPLQFVETLLTNETFVTLADGKGQNLGIELNGSQVNLRFGLNTEATVTQADIECDNGVIHIIDAVLTFPEATSTTAQEAGLSSLLEAVVDNDLATTVDTTPSITIFAPTNDAFAIADIEEVLYTLQGHVVSGVAFSTDLSDGQEIATLNGDSITVTINDDGVFVNGAQVVVPNVITQNGVVHVIDGVLFQSQAEDGEEDGEEDGSADGEDGSAASSIRSVLF
ncbi:Fasciclin domain-containing protein [Balamuthia mandrillaris]